MPGSGTGGWPPLAVVGNLNVDQWVGPLTRFPAWDEEILVDSARLELAGTAGYVLQACRGLGWDAVVVSTAGDDVFGRFVQGRLRDLGFDPAGVETLAGAETPLGMIFVGPDGQRGILSTLGAHAAMDREVAMRHDGRIAACPEVFLCGGYLLPRFGPAALLPYARALRERGQTVVFDPSWDPAGWTEHTRAGTMALLPEVDVYLPNDVELMALTGTTDLDAALDAVAGLAGETVVTRGAGGAIYARGGARLPVPAFPVVAANTIGAGDVFDVGYLYARRLGWAPERRLRFAGALAAIVVSQTGHRVYPNAATVERFVARSLELEVTGGDRGDG